MPDNEVINLHKAFDLNFKPAAVDSSELLSKKTRIKEINIDLHVSPQMLLLYPDIDSENLIKETVAAFNKMTQKLSKPHSLHFFLFMWSLIGLRNVYIENLT